MQKRAFILILIIATGCSALRKNVQKDYNEAPGNIVFSDEIKKLNLSEYNFKIDKAVINVKTGNEETRLIANIKYNKPGKYLISIRNTTGIEAARLFISSDTVLINDRINKKMFYGSPETLLMKYGISFVNLPALIGDYIGESDEKKIIKCENNKTQIKKLTGNMEITYFINCSKNKLDGILIANNESGDRIEFSFEKFRKINDMTIPGLITVKDIDNELNIVIKIEKIQATELNEIIFIPGKNYENVILR